MISGAFARTFHSFGIEFARELPFENLDSLHEENLL